MRTPEERLSPTDSSTYQLRADGCGRATEDSTDSATSCPGSLIVVSNRQPYRHEYASDRADTTWAGDDKTMTDGTGSTTDGKETAIDEDGVMAGRQRSLTVDEPTGGLTAGLDPVVQEANGTWIAWGDGEADFEAVDDDNCVAVPPGDESYTLRRIDLSEEAVDAYYYGFSNRVLWPLCHEFPTLVEHRSNDYEWYRTVNELFADAVVEHATDESIVWIQDYHFALAPRIVQESTPASVTVAQFWHVPWPTPETFRQCPAGDRLLEGLCGNDLLAFHVDRYVAQFLECVDRYLPDAAVDHVSRTVDYAGSTTRVVSTPMGIDAEAYDRDARTADPTAESVRSELGVGPETVVGLGVDRLDYSKGIPERLAAVERFFERNPGWRGEFTFVQKTSPSRTDIPAYERYGELVRSEVERINSRFETDDWQPIVYTEAYLDRDRLCRLYRRADVMVVSPLLDGMNLVAQEYVASQVDGEGVLVLSDRTGVHELLGPHALTIDPSDVDGIADQLERAVSMPRHERQRRINTLRSRVFDADLEQWMATQFDWIRRVHADERGASTDHDSDSDPRERPSPV
ncbi:alpha,alpha-trehalose-phosphate synthase (UDP-forming) [Natrarchaeobaculum sulfurireducens]|uniref:Trehalose-6-phosphate synthase n=1 Tax=Natrarchaeobaculum sulfurireducens TaxID=2044521 RepID=A0A346PGK9_9EURY|nr:trehalose-6-phosphate synthase [Natrarchaeobaculum sulfurireducens]AXR78654.1 Trehalose-6-phosphate synthase [Natrarchaeobaculum sulfurireducens]